MLGGDRANSATDIASSVEKTNRARTNLEVWLCAAVVYVVVLALPETELWQPGVVFDGKANCQIAEARAWWDGRLDLPERTWDTALFQGRAYSHFPLIFSLLAAGVVPWAQGVPHWLILLVVAGPIPLLAYGMFYRATRSPWGSGLLAVGLICGTSLWPILDRTLRLASPYYVNHALATVGLLVFLFEFGGRRRVWVAGLGLLVATMARQLTVAFAIPLVWLAMQSADAARRRRRLTCLAVAGAVMVGMPLTGNTLKFRHPLQTGYSLIYEGRDDPLARNAQTYGLFAARFVPRNLYYMNLGLPRVHRIEMAGRAEYHLRSNTVGTGIWWTTPLLLWLFVDIRRILRDPGGRSLLTAAVVVYVALMFFHATGQEQRGYNRFSLDFMPVLLAVTAPACLAGKRRWISLVMVVWSVVYFRWLL